MSLDFLSLRDYRQEEHSITHKRERNHALALQYWIAQKKYSSGYSPVLFQTLTGSHRCSTGSCKNGVSFQLHCLH